jgi:replication fork clamp-binding protein CrfC
MIKDHEAMLTHTITRVSKLEEHALDTTARLVMLDNFKKECEELHKAGEANQRRQEDATNRNTESTILLAKAVTDINITITKLVQEGEEARPVVKLYNAAESAYSFNKVLWAGIVAIAVGIVAIGGAWKILG